MVQSRKLDERRSKRRFEMQRELRYKVTGDGAQSVGGVGTTINLCSAGVAFRVERQMNITVGAFVELSISWPVLLGDTCPMRLIAFGRVLRINGSVAVCSIDKHEFRTSARTFQSTPVGRSDGMLQRWAEGMRKDALRASVAGASA